jgi:transcriptional regulator GlxA family with amidase domain
METPMSGRDAESERANGAGGLLLAPPATWRSDPGHTAKRRPRPGQISAAFLIDEGVSLLDFVGPLEVFASAPEPQASAFFGYTVAPTRGPLRSHSGIALTAEFNFEDAPMPRVLVIPAQGNWSREKLAWIRAVAAQVDVILSVGTGTFLLAETGLLDGLKATTHHQFHQRLAKCYPAIEVVCEGRFVDNGRIITAAGLTCGIDAALHVVDRYFGPDAVREAAEYMDHPAPTETLGQLLADEI